MFYSQFILAKKGPLGTIWIAAHLERKLRKNQVAETDIGNSVDSIIFPDVPIALRLSSHLLLGVVRIYSRKVNYLFDDCSEALLKVKQAFRSTAVDLPPEESTAPYHSITFPETFDLDDFELPDADIFQGNYVDHHISNKEQITLQDTMDGVVYSTSQFGLDERFGDGDTSQIGLDPEEDLLLNNVPAPGNARDGMDLDHPDESIMNENHGELSETTETLQAKPIGPEADNGNNELLEYAQAPSTPGLVEEPNLFNQKTSEFDEHFELENHLTESVSHGNRTKTLCSSPPGKNMEVTLTHVPDTINTEENGHMPVEQMIKQSEPESNSNLETQGVMLGEACDLKNAADQPCPNTGDLPENSSSFLSNGCQLDVQGAIHHETSNGITVSCQADESSSPKNELPSSGLVSLGGADSLQALRACNSDVKLHDTLSKEKEDTGLDKLSECPATLDKGDDVQGDSIKVQGNFQDTDTTTELADEMNQSADTFQQVQEKPSRSNEKTECSVTKHGDEISLSPPMSELPAPEKLLSVPEHHTELPTDFLPNTTPEEVLSVIDKDGAGVNTGQKRSFTESTPTMDSLHPAESSGKDRLRKTAESIPDDEDLLSSILVGRRSSILKLKPTPTQTEVVSMKRPRTASRSNTYKRKVLMDDTMVLHGDMIREQLVSTEDIRRVRKKAPCTRQDIWMIQKQFMEEDIVYDPISTGMSMELVCLHNQAYELSGISITKDYEPMDPTESTHEMQPPQDENVIPDTHEGAVEETNKETHRGTTFFQMENQQGEGDTSCVCHDNSELPKGDSADPSSLAKSLEQAHISEMEIDGNSGAVDEAAEHASSLPTESSSSACVITADAAETAARCATPLAEKTNGCNSITYECSSLNHSSEEKVAHYCVSTVNVDIGTPICVEYGALNELLSKEVNNDGCVEDIEFSGPLTATETHDHETLDNEGNIEPRSFSVDHCAFMKKEQNETFNEFCEPQSQVNGITDADNAVVEDNNGMDYVTAEHDTGFLNVDDDDLEADESHIPSIEETRSNIVDNSGWSSRSRAVGKYLQIMFDKEAEHGKNVIPMDNLLTGKSRKEASRMFFETLVLKTRDYIQVEQSSPFNNINLRPQSMLMKSNF